MDVSLKCLIIYGIHFIIPSIVLLSDDTDDTLVPDWVKNQASHTLNNYTRTGLCTVVGFYDRKNQITAVNCDTEVADVVCEAKGSS